MSPGNEAPRATDLAEYAGMLGRRWSIIATAMVTGLAVALLMLLVLPKTYEATASVYVSPLPGQGDTPVAGSHVTDGVNLDTEAQLLTSAIVTQGVRDRLGQRISDRTLQRRVSVSVPPNSAVLDIHYRVGDAHSAAAGANAFARAYLENRKDTAQSSQRAEILVLKKQLANVTSRISQLGRRTRRLPPGSRHRDLLVSQQNVLGFSVTNLSDRLVTLASDDPAPGQLISPAKAPPAAASPKPILVLPAGLLLGLLVGVVAAVARDRRPPRLQRAQDVERLLGLSVLAEMVEPTSDAADVPLPEYQRLCSELVATLGNGPWSLLACGESSACPAGPVAANIAQSLARAGGRVTLVPADTTSGAGADGSRAGASYVGLRLAQVRSDMPLAEQLQAARADGLLGELAASSDFVVIATPPAIEYPDAQSIAPLVNGVLLVVVLERSRTVEARQALHRLGRGHARVLGAVVVHRRSVPHGPSRPRRGRPAAAGVDDPPQEPADRSGWESQASTPAS